MRLKTSLIALAGLVSGAGVSPALAQQQAGADYAMPHEGGPPPSDGPQGSSQIRPGEERFDRVGHAGYAGEGAGVFALSNLLPPGSHAEVTALDTGRTILVAIRGSGPGLVDLSTAAARQLGVTGNPAVRIRRVSPPPQEANMIASGQPAPPRADAPPALLAGLRRQLGAANPAPAPGKTSPRRAAKTAAVPAPVKSAPVKPVTPVPVRAAGGLFVQVAALSNAQRARALADQLGGAVRSAGNMHRVQTGPYPNTAAAQRARADLARRGYGDARIVSVP